MKGELIFLCKRCKKEIKYYTSDIDSALDHIYNYENALLLSKEECRKQYNKETYGNIPDNINNIIHDCLNDDTVYGISEFIGFNNLGENK